jgi:hypothetical protein
LQSVDHKLTLFSFIDLNHILSSHTPPCLLFPCIHHTPREASSALLHRAAHYLHTRRLASELEGQASSWQLLQALYCSGDNPAGSNLAGAADAGDRQTLRQLTASEVNNNIQLRRYALSTCSILEPRYAGARVHFLKYNAVQTLWSQQ